VGVRTDRDPEAPARAGVGGAPLGGFAGHDERGQVAGGSAGDKASARGVGQAGAVGDQPQDLVLGVDRAGGLQPGDALDGRARDQHVE
jgi:hypothetical protein